MFKDGRVPGKFGFDPLGFGKDAAAFKVPPPPPIPRSLLLDRLSRQSMLRYAA